MEINLEKLAEAYSEQNKQVNRRWTVCAGVSLLAINLRLGDGNTIVFGTEINEAIVFPLVIIILSMTNLVYIVAHKVAYETAEMVQLIVADRKLDKKKILPKDRELDDKNGPNDDENGPNYGDYFYSMTSSNYNRIAPLFKDMKPGRWKKAMNAIAKFLVDTVQFSIVPIATVSVWRQMEIQFSFQYSLEIASSVAAIASIGISIQLWVTSLKYIRTNILGG